MFPAISGSGAGGSLGSTGGCWVFWRKTSGSIFWGCPGSGSWCTTGWTGGCGRSWPGFTAVGNGMEPAILSRPGRKSGYEKLDISARQYILFRKQRCRQIPVSGIGQQDHNGLSCVFRPSGQNHGRMQGSTGGNANQDSFSACDKATCVKGVIV